MAELADRQPIYAALGPSTPKEAAMRSIALCIALVLLSTTFAFAAPILTVDQSNLVGGAGLTATAGTTIGQSFVPTLDSLDAVEINVIPFASDPNATITLN